MYYGDDCAPTREERQSADLSTVRRQLAEAEARIRELEAVAITDPLTGILNRRGGELALEAAHRRTQRSSEEYSLILFDLDHFKRVNDTYGHPAGDFALKLLGVAVKLHCRLTDAAARWGGEEFLIVTDAPPSGAVRLAARLRNAVRRCVHPNVGPEGFLTASFGVTGSKKGGTPAVLLERADRALYLAKNGGRDRIHAVLD